MASQRDGIARPRPLIAERPLLAPLDRGVELPESDRPADPSPRGDRRRIERRPVRASVRPGESRTALPSSPIARSASKVRRPGRAASRARGRGRPARPPSARRSRAGRLHRAEPDVALELDEMRSRALRDERQSLFGTPHPLRRACRRPCDDCGSGVAGDSAAVNRWRSIALERSRQTATPRTLFPCPSSGGDQTAIPSWPGRTARMPPDTPLLAGRPTPTNHSPAPSYIPQLAITESTMRTVRATRPARRSSGCGRRPRASRR